MTRMTAIDQDDPGGRVFFSDAGRSLIEEDEIELISVGVDIGSSTSHLLFSRIMLERLDTQYVVTDRQVLHASDILLTPYAVENTIDAQVLGGFIAQQYAAAGLTPEGIDTGALILTGVAARRANARAIGELFAAEAGKFVAVSAGDALEALMAAQGSGAAALSQSGGAVLNIDVGGGTTKIAICEGGKVVARTALDVGARLLAFEGERIARLEPYGVRHLADAGIAAGLGDVLTGAQRRQVAGQMAEHVLAVLRGEDVSDFIRLGPVRALPGRVVFSGGVSEFIYDLDAEARDDLGWELAAELRDRVTDWGGQIVAAGQRIRATVVGASQYTVQVSGSTIFLDPSEALPLRNLAVVAPQMVLDEVIDPSAVARSVTEALARMDMADGHAPVALALPWAGSATYARLAATAKGVVAGVKPLLDNGFPLVMVVDGDIGGLLGMQCRTEEDVPCGIVSIDGIALSEFDFIDIGAVIRATGAAPVVVKSLLFPTS